MGGRCSKGDEDWFGSARFALLMLGSAAKLAALSWDPENLKKLSLNYAICFIGSQPVLSIANGFRDSQR